MEDQKEKQGTKDNYTHVRFTYGSGATMTVNKPTYLNYYPNESEWAIKTEWLICQEEG